MGMLLRRYHHKGTAGITTSEDLGAAHPASGSDEGAKKPGAQAAKAVWQDYAQGLGLDVTGKTVAQIQEAVSEHEAAQADVVKEGAEPVQETTGEQISEAEEAGVDVTPPTADEIEAQEAAGAPDPGATNPDLTEK